MNGWTSYALQDFYFHLPQISIFRLIERMSETFWPLHLLTLMLAVVAIWLAFKNHSRFASMLIAPVWAFIAYAFFYPALCRTKLGGWHYWLFISRSSLSIISDSLDWIWARQRATQKTNCRYGDYHHPCRVNRVAINGTIQWWILVPG